MPFSGNKRPRNSNRWSRPVFALAGQMRDPEVRRGLARALNTFKVVSATETESAANTLKDQATNQSPEGGA